MAKVKEDPSKALLASMDFSNKKEKKHIETVGETAKPKPTIKTEKSVTKKSKKPAMTIKEKSLSKQLSITLFSKDLDVIRDTTDILWQNSHQRTTTSDVIKIALRLMPQDSEKILKTYRAMKKEDGRRK